MIFLNSTLKEIQEIRESLNTQLDAQNDVVTSSEEASNQAARTEPSNDDVVIRDKITCKILRLLVQMLSQNESETKTIIPTDKGGIHSDKAKMTYWYKGTDMDVVGTRLLAKLKNKDKDDS